MFIVFWDKQIIERMRMNVEPELKAGVRIENFSCQF